MGLISNGSTVFDGGAFSAGFGSAMTLIKKLTASNSANLQFVNGASSVVLDGTYKEYIFVFNTIHPASDGVEFNFQVSTDAGSNYGVTTTQTYFNAYHNETDTGAALGYEGVADIASGTDEIELIREDKLSADDDHCGHGVLHLFDPGNTTFIKHYSARTHCNHAADYNMDSYVNGYFNTTSAIDAIRFKVSSGNIASGTITMYGIS